jgi:hypothetical protein
MNRLVAWAGTSAFLPPMLILLLAVRDSQNLLRAEFYAEDGLVWYAQAYEQGLASLLIPVGGYLNTVQRLVALAAQPLPLAWAPTLFNLFAWLVQAGLVLFLVSARMEQAWPQRGARVLFAGLFALMPAAQETFGILTNVQWYLALFAFLILASTPPRGAAGALLDAAVLVLGGLSGPFCLFLLPLAWQQWRDARDRTRRTRFALILLAALLQAACVVLAGRNQQGWPLGAAAALFFKIVALIPLQAEFGLRVVSHLVQWPQWQVPLVTTAIGLWALAMFAAGWIAGPRLLRQFLLFCLLMFAAALYKPAINETLEQWPLIADRPPAGGRYFLFPLLAWWGVLFCLAAQASASIKRPALLLLSATCLIAIPLDWPRWHPDLADEFQARARAFGQAPAGARLEVQTKPYWTPPMRLIKK